jgi:hypothetical protein
MMNKCGSVSVAPIFGSLFGVTRNQKPEGRLMRCSSSWNRAVLLFLFGFWFASSGSAQTQPQEIETADAFSYTRIYTDAAGVSHFGVAEITFKLTDYAPPAPPISVSQGMNVEGVLFISSPPGWHGDWHPVPRRQIMILLLGELEVRVSDGTVRTFGPGSVVLVEDTVGKGHISRVVGTERAFMVALPVEVGSD